MDADADTDADADADADEIRLAWKFSAVRVSVVSSIDIGIDMTPPLVLPVSG